MRDTTGPLLVPELHCAVPPRVSPLARRLDRAVAEWARAEDLCPTPELRRRLVRSRFGTLAARTCPDAAEERLMLHAQWLALGLFYDDVFFRPHREGVPRATALAREAADATMATISAMVPGGMPGGLPRDESDRQRFRLDTLGDLLGRMGAQARLEQFSRLGTALTLWLARQVSDEPPSETVTAAAPCLVVAGIVDDCPVTGRELAAEDVRRLTALAIEGSSWALRVHTAARRRSVAELVPALPPLLRQGAERHPQRALDRAARLHDECATAFQRLENAITPGASAPVLSYLALLHRWQRATHDWSRPVSPGSGTLILPPVPPAAPVLTSPAGGAGL